MRQVKIQRANALTPPTMSTHPLTKPVPTTFLASNPPTLHHPTGHSISACLTRAMRPISPAGRTCTCGSILRTTIQNSTRQSCHIRAVLLVWYWIARGRVREVLATAMVVKACLAKNATMHWWHMQSRVRKCLQTTMITYRGVYLIMSLHLKETSAQMRARCGARHRMVVSNLPTPSHLQPRNRNQLTAHSNLR